MYKRQIFAWDVEAGRQVTDAVSRLIPSGLGLDLLTGNVAGIFVFAIFVGIAARRMSGKYMDTVKPFLDLVNAGFSVATSVCKAVIAYKPMGAEERKIIFLFMLLRQVFRICNRYHCRTGRSYSCLLYTSRCV